jgi:hypothetical protein
MLIAKEKGPAWTLAQIFTLPVLFRGSFPDSATLGAATDLPQTWSPCIPRWEPGSN